MTQTKALNLAISRLEWFIDAYPHDITTSKEDFLRPFKEALAQPEQEPVAWFRNEDIFGNQEMEPIFYATKAWDNCQPLYTTPPQRTWVGLTDEERQQIVDLSWRQAPSIEAYVIRSMQYAEAKLKEKNT